MDPMTETSERHSYLSGVGLRIDFASDGAAAAGSYLSQSHQMLGSWQVACSMIGGACARASC